MPFIDLNNQVDDTSLKGKLLIGVVVDNNDPLHLDRIRVRVPELYEPERGELPWCLPLKTSIFGQGTGYGVYGVPAIGAKVIIECQDGDDAFPVYRNSLLILDDVNAEFDSSQKYGFVDPSGNKLLVNLEEQSFTFTHSSGSVFQFLKDGTVNLNAKTIHTTSETLLSDVSGTATINSNTTNLKSQTINAEAPTINVKSSQLNVDCPTNNFAGIINCKSLATGFGGSAGTATLQNVKVSDSLEAGGIEMITHTHTAQGERAETTGPH